jgi:hypothetical protein
MQIVELHSFAETEIEEEEQYARMSISGDMGKGKGRTVQITWRRLDISTEDLA